MLLLPMLHCTLYILPECDILLSVIAAHVTLYTVHLKTLPEWDILLSVIAANVTLYTVHFILYLSMIFL